MASGGSYATEIYGVITDPARLQFHAATARTGAPSASFSESGKAESVNRAGSFSRFVRFSTKISPFERKIRWIVRSSSPYSSGEGQSKPYIRSSDRATSHRAAAGVKNGASSKKSPSHCAEKSIRSQPRNSESNASSISRVMAVRGPI